MNSRRAWAMFVIVLLLYMVSVLQRTSLGVSGLEATTRFGVSAGALSSLAYLQVLIYAALQVPIGLVLDRTGPRLLLVVGALLMGIGQLVLATSISFGPAALGRMLVGAGDATTFISMIRLLNSWFTPRTLPSVSQWAGNVGQFGQILSALPFAALLSRVGWTPAFSVLSAASFATLALGWLLIRNAPAAEVESAPRASHVPETRRTLASTWNAVRIAVANPGTRLGFWTHFTTQSTGTVFALLWGVPYLVGGVGLSQTLAAGLLMVIVASAIVSGPILGYLISRFQRLRTTFVLAIVGLMGISWATILGWPGIPPIWLVILHIAIIGIGGPASLIGFDLARSFNPKESLGVASGIVNVGGFTASVLMLVGIGVTLDAVHTVARSLGTDVELYSLFSFRIAFLVQYLVVGAGIVMFLRARRTLRSAVGDRTQLD